MRSFRYQEIADELASRVAAAGPGEVLPSEADLSAEFAASRVTIRRALEQLRDRGMVDSKRGFGWVVTGRPVVQHLDGLATIERQLEAKGMTATRLILEYAFVDAPAHVAEVLGCQHVLRVRRLNLADGKPFAVVTVWCPAELGQHLSRHDVEQTPFYELIGRQLRGATQTIGADSASFADAAALGVPAGSAVLHCRRVTTDVDGQPVLVSEHVFPGFRTEFVVELPYAPPSTLPSGLRLVE
jgi:GntR family transcriptional regulator